MNGGDYEWCERRGAGWAVWKSEGGEVGVVRQERDVKRERANDAGGSTVDFGTEKDEGVGEQR